MHGADHLAPLAHHPRRAVAVAAATGPATLQHGIAWQQMQLWGWMEAKLDVNTTSHVHGVAPAAAAGGGAT
jgi:hypothetical protein